MLKGFSKTGKTTVTAAIIAELRKRGHTVGTVKNIHHEVFAMDTPGTDTYRHRKSGAALVCARGLRETALIFEGQVPIGLILSLYTQDFVLLEGDSGVKCPRIITGITEADLDAKFDGQTIAFSGVIAERLKNYRGLPVINGVTDTAKLVDLIVESVRDDL
ncbi:MAG: molybdopterin-guanine dinucleotide biosynthesis protein B [Clostridiales bacterium]|nr:molybdopterin-guanine dinucleotide biosynthesis protein B [Clostridiales bacterium]